MDDDAQGFIDEMSKVVDVMDVTAREKVELAAYQPKDVGQVCFEKWREEIPLWEGLVD